MLYINLRTSSGVLGLYLAFTLTGCIGDLSPEDLLERGKYLSDSNRAGEAITVLDELAAMSPSNPEVFYQRGLAWERNGDIDRALNDYSTAVGLNPKYTQAYNNRAVLRAQGGDFKDAIEDFSHVLQHSPDFVLGYKNRGLAYHDAGRYDKALEDFDRAIKLQPDASSYFLRGNLHIELKQYDEAIQDYDRSLKLDESNSRAWLNHAMALARTGKTKAARQSLRRASEMDNEIISNEIVLAMRSLSLDPTVGLDVKIEDVREAVKEGGWSVAESSEPLFPFTLRKDDTERKLMIALMDIDQQTISINADSLTAVLDTTSPKSLLIAIGSGLPGSGWQFVELWQPTEESIHPGTFKITID